MEPITYLIKSATILAMFYLIYVLFLRKETHFKAHRIFLISGVLASLCLPFLYFTETIIIDVPEVKTLVPAAVESGSHTQTVIPAKTSINWWQMTLYIYIIGVALMSLRFLRQLISLASLIWSNPARRLNSFRYIRVNKDVCPFSFFNYIVYNPRKHSEKELLMILKHEQAHAFQWHSADILLANLLLILQWANPFAWLYKKSVEENLEFLADNATIISVPDKKDYQMALVKASSADFVPALTTNFYKSFIKKRIIMLNKPSSKKRHVLKVAAVLPLLAIFLWSFNVRQQVSYNFIPSEEEPVLIPVEDIAEYPETSTIYEELPELASSEKTDPKLAIASVNGNELAKPALASVNSPVLLAIIAQDLELKISKNTTDAELEKIKEKVKKEHGIDLSYNVKRNSSNEITNIQLSYSGNGNNGNYSISDNEGISEFVFYIDDEGRTGFYNEEAEARRAERALARAERYRERAEERNKEMKLRAEEMRMRAEEMKVRSKERNKDRDKMREEIRVEREAMREEMMKQRKEMREKMKDRRKSIIIERIDDDDEGGGIFDDDEDVILKEYIISGGGNNEGGAEVYILGSDRGSVSIFGHGHGADHAIIIDKDSTDEDLAKIKSKMKAKGVEFKYSKVKRNSNGEITGIRITVDNKKGSKKTIVTKTDDGEPIDEMLIELQ